MRFKIDENLPPDLAEFLRENGHDATTVWDQGLRGKADPEIAKACAVENRVLVTLDLDFADIRAYPPERSRGLVVMRVVRQDRKHVLEVFRRMLPTLEQNELAGQLWILDEWSVRVHDGNGVDEETQ